MAAERTPEELVQAYHQAMLHLSAEELAGLFAEDARYEFPFLTPGRPSAYESRQEIYAGFKQAWSNAPVRLDSIENIAIYHTSDPSVVIVEQNMRATVKDSNQTFVRPALLIFFTKDGFITRLRDYADMLRGVKEMGRIDALIKAINQ